MTKMLKIIIIASIVCAVYAKQYAYINNNLVEFEDPVSIPYPYQELNALNVAQQSGPVLPNAISLGAVVPNVIETEAIVQSPLKVLCSLIWSAVGCLKRTFMYIITSIPTLILSLFGICNFVSLGKYFNVESILGKTELSSFINTDRLKRATEFIESAINKYRLLQNDVI